MPQPAGMRWSAHGVYVPADQLDDPDRRATLGIDAQIELKTKLQLAIDILTDMIADHTMPPWASGDEVYGRTGELRAFLQDNEIGYVLRVGCAFRVEVAPGVQARADDLVARFVGPDAWQVCSVTGSKRERRYGWAWIAATSPPRRQRPRPDLWVTGRQDDVAGAAR